MENKNHLKNIWELQQYLRSVTYGKNVAFSAVRLVFLKYIIDNNISAVTKEDFMDNSKLYRMFAARDVEGGPNAIVPILYRLDKFYNLNGILARAIDDYSRDLFGLDDRWNRKNIEDNQLRGLMGKVASLDLLGTEDEEITREIGKQIVDILLLLIENYSRSYIRQVADFSTQTQLSKIVAKILDVKESDRFVDFTSGVGKSTIQIIGDKKSCVVNVEISRETAAIAAMLYIMLGYQFNIKVDNGLEYSQQEYIDTADKVFSDYPLGLKSVINDKRVDSSILAVERALEYLNNDGIAVIPVPSGYLFRNAKTDIEARKYLIENGFLQSVISLPPCWSGTSIVTNLLIISKKKGNEVLFMDATTNKVFPYLSKKGVETLTDEGIELIIQQLKEAKDVLGAVKLVSKTKINDDYNLVPARYIDKQEDLVENITIEEIDEELKELYAIFEKKN